MAAMAVLAATASGLVLAAMAALAVVVAGQPESMLCRVWRRYLLEQLAVPVVRRLVLQAAVLAPEQP